MTVFGTDNFGTSQTFQTDPKAPVPILWGMAALALLCICSLFRGCLRRSTDYFLLLPFSCMALLLPGCMNHLFYQPRQEIFQTPPESCCEDVTFDTRDGVKLHGWFIPADAVESGTVIHFHGSFGNITWHYKQVAWMSEQGFNVFTFDYRGYGRSGGIPGRKGLVLDSVAAIEYVMSRPDIDTENLFIFGQSLGGANAVAAVTSKDFQGIKAVALEGTFSSYRREARDMMAVHVRKNIGNVPYLSLQLRLFSFLMVTDELSPEDSIHRISPIPLLVIHGTADRKVRFVHGKRLHEKAGEPKYLWTIKDGGHMQTFIDCTFSDAYRKKLMDFFKQQLR